MFRIISKRQTGFLLCLVALASFYCRVEGRVAVEKGPDRIVKGDLDPTRYITIDEVRPGMEAYCLTGYEGTEIEKFALEVLSVVHNIGAGRDAILVQGTDERFIHTGPVAGCSGSPVYIDGRLAGALSFGWSFSKDPLYGVTPIEEILRVGKVDSSEYRVNNVSTGAGVFDFSVPINFAEIYEEIKNGKSSGFASRVPNTSVLPCPLITSGLPGGVCEQLNSLVEPFGLMVVSGMGAGGPSFGSGQQKGKARKSASKGSQSENPGLDVQLVPGACLVIPLISGDMTMGVVGTVTEVVGDDVYGLGHGFLGYGPVDLPMATGQVHTIVSSVARSFKFATALETVGALTTDESAAVRGRIGAKAEMIPLTIRVERYNDIEKRVYNCQVASNRLLTPLVLGASVAGAGLYTGILPPDNTVEYKGVIEIKGAEPIVLNNVSSGLGLTELIIETVSSVAVLMNNPYGKVVIESIEFDIRISPEDTASHIWSVDLSDSRVKAGQRLDIDVVVEPVLAEKKRYHYSLELPEELVPGEYDLIVCGGYDYLKFLRQEVPYRFIPQNLASLIGAMNDVLAVGRGKLYCILVLPSGGIAIERAELPDLPATKALVLQNAKRALRTRPYPRWIENSTETGMIVFDSKVMKITVEQ